MRAAEQPLEANLDVAWLKEQVLERLETLEPRERERESSWPSSCPSWRLEGTRPAR